MSDLVDLAWLIPALPLAGFIVIALGGHKLREPWPGVIATGAVTASFGVAVATFVGLVDLDGHHRTVTQELFRWIGVGGFDVRAGLLVDPLSMTMVLFVTGISSLIHLYSIGYMHGDPGFGRYFAYLNLFVFAMTVLVLGDTLLLTFLGWEGVGVCSWLLISFWFDRDDARTAGKKAFITNRVGDWGFMLAMFLAFATTGTLAYAGPDGLLEAAAGLPAVTVGAIGLLLFVGAVGKSAQLPLSLWLPDAMAGPTPVSALIHAATMVTAGVYLMARVNPIVAAGDATGDVIAWVGALTALWAATVAVAQHDIKRVLAYSTVSQLGFMFLAVGTGAYVAAVFHMVTHAFFKALLFLGAGSVIHGMHDEQDMRRMGGLARWMPVTAGTFIVGWLAIAGVPPLSGFWSKDEILLFAWERSPALWAVGLVAALLTAYYMTRQVVLVFFGRPRFDPGEVHPHESPPVMAIPLVVLAVAAVAAGGLNLPFTSGTLVLEHWLEPVFEGTLAHATAGTATKWVLAGVSVVVALTGLGVGLRLWRGRPVDPEAAAPDPLEPVFLQHAWHYDEAVAAFMGGPGRRAAEALTDVVDARGIDGAVNGVGRLATLIGGHLRRLQTGYVRQYALGVTAGTVILLGWFLIQAG